MARKTPVQKKRTMEGKFYIYIGSGIIFGGMALFIYLMGGIDFGLFKIGGADISVTAEWAPWLIVLALIGEYLFDVKYCRNARVYADDNYSVTDFIPYVNSAVLFGSASRVIAILCALVAGFCALIIFTPVGMLLPLAWVTNGSYILLWVGLSALFVYCVVRGIEQIINKRVIQADYNSLSDEGSGGVSNWFKYLFYFIPIVRLLVLMPDSQFMMTVKAMLVADAQLEDRG